MGDRLYRTIRRMGAPFRYRTSGLEKDRLDGPALYVANHRASAGPIQCILILPMRLYPLIRSEMCRYDQAPAYLYDDFITTELGLHGIPGRALSWLICRIALPLIHGIGCVPVDVNNGFFDSSIALSLELLRQGKNLLIFPEDRLQPMDEETQIHVFAPGFAWVCYRYLKESGQSLPVYPVALSPERKLLVVGEPLILKLNSDLKEDIRRFCAATEDQVKAMCARLLRGELG